jgi:YihY family inner membrane protein
MAVIKKFADDQAGGLAALVAYYAFFSIFPLLLVFTTILAFVLQGNEELYNDVTTSVLAQFPVVGDQLQAQALTGKISALVLGVLTSLWGGLGVTQAAQNAFDKVWAVPFKDRRDFLRKRLRGLLLLMCLGVLFVLSAVITGLVTTTFHGTLVKIVGYAITLAVNFWFYMAAFRFLTAASIPTRSLWLGAAVGAVFLTILQLVGTIYIQHVIKRASNTYGTFATVIGLLVWLHLIAQLTMLATETNTVVARRLWPRSLLGPPQSTADKETLRALAEMEARDQRESVEVRFEDS